MLLRGFGMHFETMVLGPDGSVSIYSLLSVNSCMWDNGIFCFGVSDWVCMLLHSV